MKLFQQFNNCIYYMWLSLLVVTMVLMLALHTTYTMMQIQNNCLCDEPLNTSEETINDSPILVPNIVHYIWYADEPKELRFGNLLSVMSVHKTLKPDAILFHTNNEPTGEYWEYIKSVPNLEIIHREPSQDLFSEKLKPPTYDQSASDVDRLVILHETGGIYVDLDILVIQSFDDLHKYECTIGLELEDKACGAIIICSNQSAFLKMWMNSYLDDYQVDVWAYNTGEVPFKLLKRFPELVHVEPKKFHRPNWNEPIHMYGNSSFNWQDNYAVHMFYTNWKATEYYIEEPNKENIKQWNNTFGAIARWIYYGSTDLIGQDER